ncbi:hypothetical protein JCM11641_003656 [Rhodosporidiobolus odoratus]
MASTSAPMVTPSKPPPPVDISTIEAAKENIVPLHSGRSASQLAALSSSSRSGLGHKLDAEHARFAAQIAAVEAYERDGSWEEGRDGLSQEDVALLAEDPLDISHHYVRFIVANYPAGASAANKLVPVLEATTRKFLGDGRYTNDPRYFRLWAHYAKNMEEPEDCYRFLFAKGVGEKLAALYEEYAKVLEAKHKRKQADQVYNLGINRRATPLDRLKRSYLDFQARMLVAPPVPSPPRPTASSSDARTILSSSASRPAGIATGGTGVGPKGNGSMFAVFRDESGGKDAGKEAGWEDFGTVKSRQRENNEEKKEWQGEVMLQKGGAAGAKPGGFKLEVYRDETATPAPLPHAPGGDIDVFSRSTRPTSEAELLRSNPFKNYSASDVDLLTRDPLEGLEVLPRTSSSSAAKTRTSSRDRSATVGEKKERSGSSSSRSKSSSSSSAKSSSSSRQPSASAVASANTPISSSAGATGEKPKERVSVSLRALYPEAGVEYSFEELKARGKRERYLVKEVEEWNGWEWCKQWNEEVERKGLKGYVMEEESGWPLLWGKDGEPLYDFLPRPSPPTPGFEPAPVPVAAEAPPSPTPVSPTRSSQQPVHSLLSPSPPRASAITATEQSHSSMPEPEEQEEVDEQPSFAPLDPNRPPSPTINTKAANALLDHLFAKTLDFTKVNRTSSLSDSDDEPSTDESDEEDSPFEGVPGAASQYSTQAASQDVSAVETQDGEEGFVPFSQTRSQMGDDSGFYGSQRPASQAPAFLQQQPQLGAVVEDDEDADGEDNNENAPASVTATPMQLFRDAPASTSTKPIPATPAGAFRPITKTGSSARAPFGMKSGTPLAAQPPPKQPLFSVFQDQPATLSTIGQQNPFAIAGGDIIPSSQPQADDAMTALAPVGEESFAEQDEFEAPLKGGEDGDSDDDLPSRFPNDGYDLGRRLPGQSRYAPFVEQMTPIVERTLEFTAMTNLSASQRSRRESYYPSGTTAEAVKEGDEEEEPSTAEEDEEEDQGDRAFVANFAGAQPPSQQSIVSVSGLVGEEDSSFQSGSDSDSSSSSDDDDEPLVSQQQPQLLPPTQTSPPTSHFADSTLPHPHASSPAADSRSFEVSSLSANLPEGLTITGNQSGMTTDMHVGDASSFARPSDVSVTSLSRTNAPSETVDPFNRDVLSSILDRSSPSIFEHSDVHDLRTEVADRLNALQKMAKKREKGGRTSTGGAGGGKDRTGVIDEAWDLELGGEVFSVRQKFGEGTYGAVFRIALLGGDDEDDFDVEAEDELSLAVKVEKPTNLWEFHILDLLHSRLSERTKASVVAAHRLYAYQDESFLFLDSCDQGTLLDAVNRANDSGVAASLTGAASQGLDELLAMFFVVELLRVVEGFHSIGFIHGDLKIDNCLLRLEDVPGGARAWSSSYDPSGANGWSAKGVKLIDFGRSIDLTEFPAGQRFSSESAEVESCDCNEMKEGKDWSFEPDYFGIAGIAFNLLFGKHIETKKVPREDGAGEEWVLVHTWKRYYQVELWSRLFGMLLNPRSVREGGALPITDELAEVRREMEEYLKVNGEKSGKSLRGLIKKLEIYAMAR